MKPCRHEIHVKGCVRCEQYLHHPRLRWVWDGKITAAPEETKPLRTTVLREKTPNEGVGTELKVLLASLGLSPGGCNCEKRAREMDRWGVEVCKSRREEILGWLREEQQKRGWREYFLATKNAARELVLGRIKTVISPLDPAVGLLDEAIRRAEAQEKARAEASEERGRAEKEREARERAKSLPIEIRVVDNVSRVAVETRKEAGVGEPPTGVLSWAYGVTTVAERRADLLPRTLRSLSLAGFPFPTLYVDGATAEEAAGWGKDFNLPVVARNPRIRTFGNWFLALAELYLRNPDADRYAMFQDDFVTYRNLRGYLEAAPFPEKGYLNLMTWSSNVSRCPKDKDGSPKIGFYESNQLGRGAVALVFDNEGVVQLLASEHMVRRSKDKDRGWKAIDGGIVTAMKKVGYTEYVHNPTLVHHVGKKSVMGNKTHPDAPGFKGEVFSALNLLRK